MEHTLDSLKAQATLLMATLMSLIAGGEGCLAELTRAVKALEDAVRRWLYHTVLTEPEVIRYPDLEDQGFDYSEIEREIAASAANDSTLPRPPEPEIKSAEAPSNTAQDTVSEDTIICPPPEMSPRRRAARDREDDYLRREQRRLPKSIRECPYLDLMKRLSALQRMLQDPERACAFLRTHLIRAGALLPEPQHVLCGRNDYDPEDPYAYDDAVAAYEREEREQAEHDERVNGIDLAALHAQEFGPRPDYPDWPDLPVPDD